MFRTVTTFALLPIVLCCGSAAGEVTFDWVTVGNPGNAADTRYDATGFGSVDYTYRISKHEVTNAQYAEFLNAVDPTGANSLTLYSPSAGIGLISAAADGFKYKVKRGLDDNPAAYVAFGEAMRFTNWLENGQGSGGTETGAYTIGNGANEVRNPNATYFIPSEDEWYKAAYYDPIGVYYDYATGTDTEPYSDNPSSLNTPDDTNVANFFKDDFVTNGYNDGYTRTGSPDFDPNENYLTDVGSYSLATSPYGTYDQSGNVFEWNEAVGGSSSRILRGGSWNFFEVDVMYAGARYPENAMTFRRPYAGFRVASVFEPTADFNDDGVADGSDFLLWQRGESPNPLSQNDLTSGVH